MKKVFLILGYNNTRIDDVQKIRDKANAHFGASVVLCKPTPTAEDQKAVDDIIDVPLSASFENVGVIMRACNEKNLKIIGVLPFSDPGTQLGALVAKELNLPGADPERVSAAFNKFHFRQQESKCHFLPHFYHPIQATRIETKMELHHWMHTMKGEAFLKPMQEGNSRGCTLVQGANDIDRAWEEVSPYANGGIMLEENISGAQEYSFDRVANYSWITEKETTQNEYRAEIQQIVPTSVPENVLSQFLQAGKVAADLSGSNGGACHNEFFWMKEAQKIAIVEPNLRPAGMRIWDLAGLAFENFDPWNLWLSWASGKEHSTPQPWNLKFYAGIRMILSPANGIISKLPNSETILQELKKSCPEVVEIFWSKSIGAKVQKIPSDNAGFIGHVIAKSTDPQNLKSSLKNICEIISNQVEVL
ncbi:MAG: hypothetical protein Q7T03_07570 [Deltaproteobacteria bacterium]|nr:hypothetical protein [Deltaproteobacteria bacterium]